jgi:GGDEF domain-containing protein
MNISGYEFQVIFCALILLGLAAVALIVDYLKGMNEKLRERHIELMSKHEVVVQRVEEDNTRLLRALAEQSKAFRDMNKRSPVFFSPTEAPAQLEAAAEPPAAAPQALVEGSSLPPAQSVKTAPAKEAAPASDFDRFMEQLVTEFEETASTPLTDPAQSLDSLAHKLDELSGNLIVPAGTHPASALKLLLEREGLMNGLVLSVGINEYLRLNEIHGPTAAEELLHTVDLLMSQIAGDSGFCSRCSDDEFVLIFPQVSGAKAQQRLAEISERLWDYQFQNLGTFTAVFSWGAAEAQMQPLSEALALASESMLETRGSRKHATPDPSEKQRTTA